MYVIVVRLGVLSVWGAYELARVSTKGLSERQVEVLLFRSQS